MARHGIMPISLQHLFPTPGGRWSTKEKFEKFKQDHRCIIVFHRALPKARKRGNGLEPSYFQLEKWVEGKKRKAIFQETNFCD